MQHDAAVLLDSISCLEAIKGEDTANPPLPYREPPLGIELNNGMCPFQLGVKPLWHWGYCDNGASNKRDHWLWHRAAEKWPMCGFEAARQLLNSIGDTNEPPNKSQHQTGAEKFVIIRSRISHKENSQGCPIPLTLVVSCVCDLTWLQKLNTIMKSDPVGK